MKPIKAPTTGLEKAKEILAKSGNSFHYRVVNFLRQNGWSVTVSPYYNDTFSQKPREIDLIAEKAFPIENRGSYEGAVIVRLFIECKYITSTTLFWFDERDLSRTMEVVEQARAFHDPKNNVLVAEKHHYLEKESLVAKLFDAENANKEQDPIFKSITQSLNSMVY